jgi:hypothetical protein
MAAILDYAQTEVLRETFESLATRGLGFLSAGFPLFGGSALLYLLVIEIEGRLLDGARLKECR